MWRDEIQAWLLARDSSTIIELFKNIKYEGHPGLWHLCLFPLSHIHPSPLLMQSFHLMLATATVYIFLRFSPFTRLQKTLFAFGYFPFYEYAIVSRSYALGVLLLLIFCVLFENRFAKFLWIGCLLFLLAHISVHYTIITIAIFLALAIEYLLIKKENAGIYHSGKLKIIIGFSIILFGIITSIIQVKPPADSGYAVGWKTDFDLNSVRDVFLIISRAFVPLTQHTFGFWGSSYIDKLPSLGTFDTVNAVRLIISSFILLWAAMIFLRNPTSLFMYIIGTVGLLAFFYTKYFGSLYHHGLLFMLFIASVWISKQRSILKLYKPLDIMSSWLNKHNDKVLSVILIAHVIGGVIATRMDYLYTFSQGKAAANFVKKARLDNSVIVGDVDYVVSTLAGYLENKIYYTRGDRLGSYVIWDKKRNDVVVDIFDKSEQLGKEYSQDILLVLSYSLDESSVSQHSLREVARFQKSVTGEEYYLYLLKRNEMLNQ